MKSIEIREQVPLKPFTTLRVGGPAERLAVVRDVEELAMAALLAQATGTSLTTLGSGSNVLPSDAGVPGLVVLNRARRIEVAPDGEITADTGCGFQELFLKAAQAGLSGLEFAVGIPGTLGGALASNAGAYRSCVGELLIGLEVVAGGRRAWVAPEWMEFSYRDSRLRRQHPEPAVVLRVRLRLVPGEPKRIYDEAREYQRQRIGKQPPSPSAGSFFKNVQDVALAGRLETLPPALKRVGIVPAGYLIEACGLKGRRVGGAMLGVRHANFILNVGNACAADVRRLAGVARRSVRDQFGVELEEEVLYLGDWSRFAD